MTSNIKRPPFSDGLHSSTTLSFELLAAYSAKRKHAKAAACDRAGDLVTVYHALDRELHWLALNIGL